MKVGDKVEVEVGEVSKLGRIVRFYANQGTVLVEMESGKLSYFSYDSLERTCS